MPNYYNQSQIDYDVQIKLLKSEGLRFKDETLAKHLLKNISFFRFKAYLRPFRVKGSRQFKAEIYFEQAYSLYKFDSELRKMLAAELEKIEVSVRTQLSYSLTDAAGNFWFANPANFSNSGKHNGILKNVQHELSRSDDEDILNYFKQYADPYPPSWMTMEVTSFGSLSMLYKWHKAGHARRNVANFYGLSDKAFESWLHSMVYLRNICAHHGRLWNRSLRIQPVTPKTPQYQFLTAPADKDKLFFSMSIILYFLRIINPSSTFATRIKDLLKRYPMVDVSAMGFPADWEQEPLWRVRRGCLWVFGLS